MKGYLLLLMLLGIICSAHAACTQSECSSWQYCLGTCKTCSSNANCQESHSLRTVCSSTACVQCSSFSDCTGSWPSNCISGLGLCGTSVASCSGSCTSPTPNCIQYSGQNYCVACELDNDIARVGLARLLSAILPQENVHVVRMEIAVGPHQDARVLCMIACNASQIVIAVELHPNARRFLVLASNV